LTPFDVTLTVPINLQPKGDVKARVLAAFGAEARLEFLLHNRGRSLPRSDRRTSLASAQQAGGIGEESFKTSYREDVENQREKDMAVYAVRDAVSRLASDGLLRPAAIKGEAPTQQGSVIYGVLVAMTAPPRNIHSDI
jgi:hypothetical protein